ncbi:hypothetical protein HAX54_039257 [Datura stramonium]|uniref:Uncharacterized protein n=1 Tax=Datura stramonium TaxID=4076 RepID=A0ABS8VMD1_DATST|nr:hypothetical protein [Datura stramonium]
MHRGILRISAVVLGTVNHGRFDTGRKTITYLRIHLKAEKLPLTLVVTSLLEMGDFFGNFLIRSLAAELYPSLLLGSGQFLDANWLDRDLWRRPFEHGLYSRLR